MATILNGPITVYYSPLAAAVIAWKNREEDTEADYRVEPYAGGYCIAVYVDGELMVRL